jgi:SAM-dependent methyltransferase
MNRQQLNILCPGCGFTGVSQGREIHGHDLLICDDCGLAFCWPRPTEAEVSEFYHSLDLGTNLYGGQSPTKRAFFSLCHDEIKRHFSTGRILDFGCGDCCFLNEAGTGDFELFGADLHSGVEKIQHQRKIQFFIGPLQGHAIHDGFFDVIFTSATYEHFLCPGDITKEFYRLLKPGGMLFIVSVPNYDSINIRLKIEDWLINRPPAHINFFNVASLKKHLERYGFVIHKSRTYGFNHEPIKRRLKGVRADISLKELVEADEGKSAKEPRAVSFLHRMVASIYFRLPYFGLGDKLAFVAIKPQ